MAFCCKLPPVFKVMRISYTGAYGIGSDDTDTGNGPQTTYCFIIAR